MLSGLPNENMADGSSILGGDTGLDTIRNV